MTGHGTWARHVVIAQTAFWLACGRSHGGLDRHLPSRSDPEQAPNMLPAAAPSTEGDKGRSNSSWPPVEFVPGRSIGVIQLRMSVSALPPTAVIDGSAGRLDDINFVIRDGLVDDVWIDDVRTFPHVLTWRGRVISPDIPLHELQALFGGCSAREGIFGGRYYNCEAGVALGLSSDDFDTDPAVQLRVQHR